MRGAERIVGRADAEQRRLVAAFAQKRREPFERAGFAARSIDRAFRQRRGARRCTHGGARCIGLRSIGE
ncbi:hypothetical protein DP49_5012 [Burkholderia pseudomallei]|nr:putative aMP-binding enzyme domain protein [Burkholderia pseudomallei]KGD58103.1 hypothetical protein DP49_5012 [Burkholderia pseudomallei]KOT10596.1 AMP-binding enzyme domain protein [Burkholderia mallei]